MTKKAQRQNSGKSQISLVATRLAEILPRYGLVGLKHAQAIEIAGIAAGFRTSNAAIAAATDLGPLPQLEAIGTAEAAGEVLTVLLDPASNRRFAVDASFSANPPAGCLPTPYGTLAAPPKAGALPIAPSASGGPQAQTYVGYIEHKHGHHFVYGATEDEMWTEAAQWCSDESPDHYASVLAESGGDVAEAVVEFTSRDGFIHVDSFGSRSLPAAPAASYAPVFSANISHRHGLDVVNGTSEEDLLDQVAGYCVENERELPHDKPFPRPVAQMSSAEIAAHYFASVADEFVEYNGETGSIPVPAGSGSELQAVRSAMRSLMESFRRNQARWASGEAYDDEDLACCDRALADAEAALSGRPPSSTPAKPGPRGKGDIHVALVTHGSGTNAYTGPTEEDVRTQVAAWCREYWKDAGSPTTDDPSELADEEAIYEYFDCNDEESVTFGCDEGAGSRPSAVPRVLVTVRSGMAEIEAVDGVADVALVDFDVDDILTEDEVETRTSFERLTGDRATLDGLLEGHRTFLREHFGSKEEDEDEED